MQISKYRRIARVNDSHFRKCIQRKYEGICPVYTPICKKWPIISNDYSLFIFKRLNFVIHYNYVGTFLMIDIIIKRLNRCLIAHGLSMVRRYYFYFY